MATVYIKFQSSSEKIYSIDCTNRWPDSVGCSIPMSGLYEGKRTNLAKMDGDVGEIAAWIANNPGKVIEITEEVANIIGQEISPEGRTNIVIEDVDGVTKENTYTAGLFTMADGQTWELTNSVEI